MSKFLEIHVPTRREAVRMSAVFLGAFVLMLGAINYAYQQELRRIAGETPVAGAFNPFRLLPQLPPITEFDVVPADKVGDRIQPTELVIGTTLNGESRAYPINMLVGPRREILNDTLGDTAIAATW